MPVKLGSLDSEYIKPKTEFSILAKDNTGYFHWAAYSISDFESRKQELMQDPSIRIIKTYQGNRAIKTAELQAKGLNKKLGK